MYVGDALNERAICSPTVRFPWGKSPNALATRSKPPSPKPSKRRRGSRPLRGALSDPKATAATSLSNNLAQAEARAPQADLRHQRSVRCRIRHEKPTILDKNRRLRGSPLPSGTPTPPRGRKTRGALHDSDPMRPLVLEPIPLKRPFLSRNPSIACQQASYRERDRTTPSLPLCESLQTHAVFLARPLTVSSVFLYL